MTDERIEPPEPSDPPEPRERRPFIERIGLAAVALAAAVMFGGVGYAAWLGGELFLAAIGAISCVMTLWVGVLTLVRG
jgi:hypothetical protein